VRTWGGRAVAPSPWIIVAFWIAAIVATVLRLCNEGPSGTPLALFESGAILLYLADKTGQFISTDPNTRYETIQWVMWQMGGVGPMFGQVSAYRSTTGDHHTPLRESSAHTKSSNATLPSPTESK
jgi:hypothetical protein